MRRQDNALIQRARHIYDPRVRMLKAAVVRARRQGVPFNLTLSDLMPVPERCPVLGIELRVGIGLSGSTDNSPTLDRIVPEVGYVPGNVVIVSRRANRLKSDAAVRELKMMAKFYTGLGGGH